MLVSANSPTLEFIIVGLVHFLTHIILFFIRLIKCWHPLLYLELWMNVCRWSTLQTAKNTCHISIPTKKAVPIICAAPTASVSSPGKRVSHVLVKFSKHLLWHKILIIAIVCHKHLPLYRFHEFYLCNFKTGLKFHMLRWGIVATEKTVFYIKDFS